MAGSYAQLARIKTYLDKNDNDDDTLLNNLIAIADQNLEHALKPWAAALPLDIADKELQAIADFDVVGSFKLIMKELEAYDRWNGKRTKKINSFIAKLKSDFAVRTLTVSVTKDHLSEPLLSE